MSMTPPYTLPAGIAWELGAGKNGLTCFGNADCRCGCRGDPQQELLTCYLIQGSEYDRDGRFRQSFCCDVWATTAAQALNRFAGAARRRRSKRYSVGSINATPEVFLLDTGARVPHLYERGQRLVQW